MPKSIHCAATAITALLCAPLFAFAETNFDCGKSDDSILYRVEPCDKKGEQKNSEPTVDPPTPSPAPTPVPDPDRDHDQNPESGNKEPVESKGSNPIDIVRARNGIYQVPGSINGHAVLFNVDTGASNLSISTQEAEAYDVKGCRPGKSATANGVIDICMTTASEITFGEFRLEEVSVIVVPNLVGNPLLGMNVLSQFKIEQTNGVMRISKY
jgi:clan AA aspartic protease (TIGR02281 family)